MGRPPVIPAEQKSRIVMSVLAGEMTIAELTQALGEAAVEPRVWKKSAEGRLGPSRTSR
jgi:transposase